ncbi:MAG: DinB family protein [Bdellovibrionota bacterium]
MDNVKLEAPGKGLPFLESLLMRFYVGPVLSKKDSSDKNWERFDKMNKKILEKVKELSLEQMHTRVLVPRLRAIEDSSRYWSVAETLEHIELVGDNIAGLIELLCKNEVPDVVVDVADYKPKGKYSGVDPRPAFEKFNTRVQEQLKAKDITLHAPLFKHPWMGEISALQWLWLLSGHSGIHYNQIKCIIKAL